MAFISQKNIQKIHGRNPDFKNYIGITKIGSARINRPLVDLLCVKDDVANFTIFADSDKKLIKFKGDIDGEKHIKLCDHTSLNVTIVALLKYLNFNFKNSTIFVPVISQTENSFIVQI